MAAPAAGLAALSTVGVTCGVEPRLPREDRSEVMEDDAK